MPDLDAEMFEGLFLQTTTPISVLTANPPRFTVAAINEHYKKNSRTPTEGIVGKPVFDVYQPWDEESRKQFDVLKNGLMTAINQRQQVNLPVILFEAPLPDGTIHRAWMQFEITPIYNRASEVSHLMCITRNVTDRELAKIVVRESAQNEVALNAELQALNEELKTTNEELVTTVEELNQSKQSLQQLNDELEQRVAQRTRALSDSEKRYRQILDALPEIAWTSTMQGEVDFYNQRWYDYTGLNFDQTKDSGWQKVIHPDDLQYNVNTYAAILQSKEPGEFEIRERGADGIYRWHLVRIRPLMNHDGVVDHWIGTATEIEALKQLQQQKDDFISIASHELKTPLTTLKASLQVIEMVRNNPVARDKIPGMLAQSSRSVDKLCALVNSLLDVSKLQLGTMVLDKNSFNLAHLLNSCCNSFSILGTHQLQVIGDDDVLVNADEHRIEQVVINFISNAVKHAPGAKDINITVAREGANAKVTVADKGPGIPADQLPRLFDRYYRGETEEYQASGLGIGLYISAEIIKQHGGQIGVASEQGKGSNFWFKIPLTA